MCVLFAFSFSPPHSLFFSPLHFLILPHLSSYVSIKSFTAPPLPTPSPPSLPYSPSQPPITQHNTGTASSRACTTSECSLRCSPVTRDSSTSQNWTIKRYKYVTSFRTFLFVLKRFQVFSFSYFFLFAISLHSIFTPPVLIHSSSSLHYLYSYLHNLLHFSSPYLYSLIPISPPLSYSLSYSPSNQYTITNS